MSSASEIIDALGGTSAVAKSLGVIPSVVHGWRRFNSIPAWRQPAIMELAFTLNVPLVATDFPTPAERLSRVA